MGLGLEVVTGFVTAPSTTFTAWTLASGNSLTVRNFALDKRALLLSMWADNQAAGTLRLRSPKLHDNVQGIRLNVVASEVLPLQTIGLPQQLFPQDQLIAEQTGSATAGDIETGCLLIWYEDLPGTNARLIDWKTLQARRRNIMGNENTLSLGTAGGYSGEEAINAEFDLLKANTDYALLGYLCSAECACVRWRGVDFGNLGVGGPGTDNMRHLTADWFCRLSKANDMALIPVFNSANKGAVLLDGAQDENGTDVTVTSILCELG